MMPRLHHIAIGARDVERVAAFYVDVFGAAETNRHHYESGELRSIWLDADGVIVMIEHTRDERRHVEGVGAGPFLIAFEIEEGAREEIETRLAEAGAPIESRTPFSSYTRDPEGTRVAISHYPRPSVSDE